MGRSAQISRDDVLRASLVIADSAGLDAVTMQAVARRLGVTPMALYRHVAGKADLLDALVEGLLTEFPLPEGDLPPGERLRALGRGVREVARRHPSLFPLLLQRPAATPGSRRVRDAVRAALEETGLGAEQARRAERLLSTVVLGFAASEAAGRFRDHPRSVIDQDFACLERVISQVLEDLRRPGYGPGRLPDRPYLGLGELGVDEEPERVVLLIALHEPVHSARTATARSPRGTLIARPALEPAPRPLQRA